MSKYAPETNEDGELVYTFFHVDGPIRLTETELCNEFMRLREALQGPITREHAIRAAQNAVRNQGYAVAVHGSQVKDLDLLAVPWRETAIDAQGVAEMIAAAIPGFIEKGSPEEMPHGRLSFTIRPNWHYGFDSWYIDLAVMPRVPAAALSEREAGK